MFRATTSRVGREQTLVQAPRPKKAQVSTGEKSVLQNKPQRATDRMILGESERSVELAAKFTFWIGG